MNRGGKALQRLVRIRAVESSSSTARSFAADAASRSLNDTSRSLASLKARLTPALGLASAQTLVANSELAVRLGDACARMTAPIAHAEANSARARSDADLAAVRLEKLEEAVVAQRRALAPDRGTWVPRASTRLSLGDGEEARAL